MNTDANTDERDEQPRVAIRPVVIKPFFPSVPGTLATLCVALITLSILLNGFVAVSQSGQRARAAVALDSLRVQKRGIDRMQDELTAQRAALYARLRNELGNNSRPYVFPLTDFIGQLEQLQSSCGVSASCAARLSRVRTELDRLSVLTANFSRASRSRTDPPSLADPDLIDTESSFHAISELLVQTKSQKNIQSDSMRANLVTRVNHTYLAGLGVALSGLLALIALLIRQNKMAGALRLALSDAQIARKKYQHLFEEHPLPLWVFDDATLYILTVNAAATQAYGYSAQEMEGMSLRALRPNEEVARMDAAFSTKLASRGSRKSAGLWVHRTKSGERRLMDVRYIHADFQGRPATMAVMIDVTELAESQAKLTRQARYDALTGLPNRLMLDEHLVEALARMRETNLQLSVLFLDLDRFKQVNDSLGHRVGDQLLTLVAQRLLQEVRETDLVARYGGDEFVLIIEDSRRETLTPILERLIATMSESVQVGDHELFIQVSIGVSIFPEHGDDADTLMRNSDAAMYAAKEKGRNGYQFYRPELNEAATHKLALSTRLRRAILARELDVAYQVQVDMRDGRFLGAEALVRWTDAELGSVPPDVFVPLAEEIGLINQIGAWVLSAACVQARNWRESAYPDFTVSVNVSPIQFERGALIEVVRSVLRDTHLPPHALELEITEGALMRKPAEVARLIKELRELGVSVAIDDFGTGYSSLSYLKHLKVDCIKIDRAFIQDIGLRDGSEALAASIVRMVKALGFDVVAEGVQEDVHRRFLVENGCVKGQGYLFSRPVSAEALSTLIANT